MIPVFIINLERDTDRRQRIAEQLSKIPGLEPIFVTAVNGSTLPEQVCAVLTNQSWAQNKGTIGCFLSHFRVWEILATQSIPYALVIEDDVEFIGTQALDSLNLPSDFDIVFVNDQMSRELQATGFVEMSKALPGVDVKGEGFGGYGYILKPSAAAKLLGACATDLYTGHVDGRLVRYATSPETLDTLGDSFLAEVIQKHHDQARLPQLGLLRGYVMASPMVRHYVAGPSSRATIDAQNTQTITSAAAIRIHQYDLAKMTDPPDDAGLLKILEAPRVIPRKMPEFVDDFSGRGLELNLPAQQDIHGSYLVRRENVLLFGPNHLISLEGHWSCEARTAKEQYLQYFHQPFYDHIFPGPKPEMDYLGSERLLKTSKMTQADVELIDTPVFLATPLEPPIWGRWIATVVPKVMHYKQYGAGRKFLCHISHDWERAFLKLLGLDESDILAHDPGRTFICRDVMTTEYSATNMTVSMLERSNFYELVAKQYVQTASPKKLFVSRLSRSKANPNYRALQNETKLAAMLEELGFFTIEPELLPIERQISIFSTAEQVVCLGGSGLFNAAFCAPGTSVVTIESSNTYIGTHTEFLASLDLRYGVIFGREDPEDQSEWHKRWTIDVPRVREALTRFFPD